MSLDTTRLGDQMIAAGGFQRPSEDVTYTLGHGVAEVYGPDGELKQSVPFTNLITQVGEQMYGEGGALGTGTTVPKPTGMALGTDNATAATKTGAGAALVAGMSASAVALTGTPTSSVVSTKRRITYTVTWAAGVATQSGPAIGEVVLQNGTATTVPTNAATTNIISRALLSPTVNKGSADTLTITWNHDIGS